MHNRALHDTLAAFVEEAAWQLAEEVSGGAEIPFELIEQGRSSAPLYCYKPLTQRFLAERAGSLGRLGSYVPAVQGLMAVPDLPSYLRTRGRRPSGSDPRSLADAALQAFVAAVWQDATDFGFDDARFAAAYAELEDAVYAGCALSLVVTPVDGLVIESPEVSLGGGLTLVRGVDLADGPPELRGDEYATVAVLTLESQPGDEQGLDAAGRRLRRLQSALRLWDDAEPALGPTAWARTDGAPWLAIPLATGLRRTTGDCLLAPEDEDPLRAFCSLVGRRTPRVGRARLGAAPLRARLRARHRARGADGLAAVRPRAARRARRDRLRADGGADRRDLRDAGASATRSSTACAARSPWSARWSPASCGRSRSSRRWSPRSAPACGRSSATCSAATSTRTCAGSRTGCWPTSRRS